MSSNFFLADRVKELSRVEGRVNIALDGSVDGFSSFGDFYASGDTVFYAITDNIQYEAGSGMYIPEGSTGRSLTRNVLRSSDINSGPYYLYGSGDGPHAGVEGYFYPMWLTQSSALSGVGLPELGYAPASLGPYPSVHEHIFSGHPGVTFYMPNPGTTTLVLGHGLSHSVENQTLAAAHGSDYVAASRPVDFSAGTKEVFVTYPGARAVINTYGAESDVREPKESGIAIWKNGSVISYSPDLVWDDTNSHLGVKQGAPAFAIDVGGLKSFSQIRASGFIDGGSGIWFSGVAGQFSGGRQLEPFLRNEVGETANGVVKLSGTVDEFIGFESQAPMLVFAGPESDCGCTEDIPTFRALTAEDMPLTGDDGLDNKYVKQNNDGLGTASEYPYQNGMVALYAGSGEITYDSGIVYMAGYNRLGLGGASVGTIAPAYTLDVSGNMAANSGYFDQVLFTDNIIKIGHNTGNDKNNAVENYYTVNIGRSAGLGSSGNFDTVFIGHEAGLNIHRESGSLVFGTRAGEGSVSGFQNIIIGNYAASGASGIRDSVIIGNNAGQYANRGELDAYPFSDIVAIGKGAASGAGRVFQKNIAIGSSASSHAVNSTGTSAIGYHAMTDASGVTQAVALGVEASEGLHTSLNVVSIGTVNLNHADRIYNVDSIGNQALYYANGIFQTVAIGYQAGYEARDVSNGVFLGEQAGQEASGSYNVYLGRRAGHQVSGHNNIEIIALGHDTSTLAPTSNHAINIGNTIVGTANSGVPSADNFSNEQGSPIGIGIGYMEDASPPATLYVRPSGREDHAFIIRHQGSGGTAPYVALQSGDATTFFHITNSGDVVTSGFMNPSGGLLLEAITPADTDNRLYNDGGTLKFDGDAIGGAGSMDHWELRVQIDDVRDTGVDVSNNQTVVFSGIKGIDIQYEAVGPAYDKRIIVDSSPLSGVLQDQIDDLSGGFDASEYSFFHANIGPARDPLTGNVVDQTTGGAGKYAFARSELKEVPDEGAIAFSGVNGITVDLTTLAGNGYTSGIYEIGWDASSSYGWNVMASGENPSSAPFARNVIHGVPDGSGVAFSGIRGTQFGLVEDQTNDVKVLVLDPYELSGVLYDTTIESGNYIWNDWAGEIDWRGSGIAVSGLAVSNYDAIQGITSKSATSGIAIKNDKYVLDSGNGGQLSFLVLQDLKANDGDTTGFEVSSGNILITDRSGLLEIPSRGSNTFTTAIGSRVGEAASGHSYTVMIGHLAGGNSQANTFLAGDIHRGNSVFIGRKAGHGFDSTVQNWDDLDHVTEYLMANNILIGSEAGDAASGVGHSIGIGKEALLNSVRQIGNISLGSFSSRSSVDSTGVVAIGNESNSSSRHTEDGVFIGNNAHEASTKSTKNVGIGLNAMNSSSGLLSCVAIGDQAMQEASGAFDLASTPPVWEDSTFIVALGYRAASKSSRLGTEGGVYIGRDSAFEASGTDNSVFIGNYAGQKTSHKNSIIISNKGLDLPSTDTYPIDWAHHDEDYVLDIAHGIQGKIQTGPHTKRDGVENTYFTDGDDVRIHIGPCVGLSEKEAGHKLTTRTVEIQPTNYQHAALTLDQPFHHNHPVDHTRERIGRLDTGNWRLGGPMLQVTTDTVQSTTPPGGDLRNNLATGPDHTNLDIINRHGYPVMPMFGYYDTTNGNLHTNNTDDDLEETLTSGRKRNSIIPRYPGAYVMGYFDVDDSGDNWWLAICVEYQGSIGANPLVVNDTGSSEHGLIWKFIKMT